MENFKNLEIKSRILINNLYCISKSLLQIVNKMAPIYYSGKIKMHNGFAKNVFLFITLEHVSGKWETFKCLYN
jgi:hypothetical protein